MNEATQQPNGKTEVKVETTECPECGTNWEVVVTQRARSKTVDPHEE